MSIKFLSLNKFSDYIQVLIKQIHEWRNMYTQNNKYYSKLHGSSLLSPFHNIYLHKDASCLKGNYMTIGIRSKLQSSSAVNRIKRYVKKLDLEALGAILQPIGDVLITHYKVECVNARSVIDRLFANKVMSTGDRSKIENELRKMEKTGEFSMIRSGAITEAQKDLIRSFIGPYVEVIKEKAPDAETAKNWVISASIALKHRNSKARDYIPSYLYHCCRCGHHMDKDFYDSLYYIAKVYCSMADLETALLQSGETLPDQSIIQQLILDFLISSVRIFIV